jgi:lactobin A/cerein 7B family class IIb bacteriocin
MVHFAYENVLLDIKEKIMVASHVVPSGFAPVSDDELMDVNGGVIPLVVVAVAKVVIKAVIIAALVSIPALVKPHPVY